MSRLYNSVSHLALCSALALVVLPIASDFAVAKGKRLKSPVRVQIRKPDLKKPFQSPIKVEVQGNGAIANFVNKVQETRDNVDREANDVVAHGAKELGNLGENTVEAVQTAGKYFDDRLDSLESDLKAAAKRAAEGKVVDAYWNFVTDNLKSQSEDAARATQRSSMLRTIAQVTVSTFYGPGGAAAFSAWYTYYATDNIDQALKAGAIAYAVGSATGAINAQPAGDFVKNALASGVVGGTAAAASGGDFEQGAKNAAIAYAANYAYRAYTQAQLDTKPASKEAYIKSGDNADTPEGWDGDVRKLDPSRNHIGKASDVSHPSNPMLEGSSFMRAVNKMPGMNGMAYFHDIWSADWRMATPLNEATILPAAVLTYTGAGLQRDREQLDQSSKPKE